MTGPGYHSAVATPEQRRQRLTDTRRALVLDAARAVFQQHGLAGANMREIARRAGYTPGAIYSYFDSKEAIYGALLAESLERLNAAVTEAVPDDSKTTATAATTSTAAAAAEPADSAAAELRARSCAWFAFFTRNPRDLDQGFYLVQGLAERGLTPDLNRALNLRLHDALAPGERALVALGLAPSVARFEATALFAQGVGLLLLRHTGRIKLFGQDADALFNHYLDRLIDRLTGR